MHESETLVLVAAIRVGDRRLGSGQVLLPRGIVITRRPPSYPIAVNSMRRTYWSNPLFGWTTNSYSCEISIES